MTDEGTLHRMICAHNNHTSNICTYQITALPAIHHKACLIAVKKMALQAAASGGACYDP